MTLPSPPFRLAALLLVVTAACSGGDGSPDDHNQGDNDLGDSQLTDFDTDDDGDSGGDESGDLDGGDGTPGDTDGCGTATGCPAPAACANQMIVYADGLGSGWTSGGFSASPTTETGNVCSGTKAFKYVSHHFDGFFFAHTAGDVAANHISLRVYVSEGTNFTIAPTPEGEDGHCYRLPTPTTCGENGPCGPDQHAAPCILHWDAGWNTVEIDIPASTGVVKTIFFERQNEGGETVTVIVDDLRLTQP